MGIIFYPEIQANFQAYDGLTPSGKQAFKRTLKVYDGLTPRGKQAFKRLLKAYPEGNERDRMVYGIWMDCNPCVS